MTIDTTLQLHRLQRHTLSQPFGTASPTDKQALLESIRNHGFDPRHAITLLDGKILDGWHRYNACLELGVAPQFEDFTGTDEEAMDFVFSENMARRQLLQPQKVAAFITRNQFLPPDRQLTHMQIAVLCGKQSLAKVAQLQKLADVDLSVAQEVAAGTYKGGGGGAVRDVLNEEPVGKSETVVTGAFTVKDRVRLQRFEEARKSMGWTVVKSINKAIDLFVEWVEGQHEAAK